MYKREYEGWMKHMDFILIDMLCLQLAFCLAYVIRNHDINPYTVLVYRNIALYIELVDVIVIFSIGTLKGVLRRGHYKEFLITVKHTVVVEALALLYLFVFQRSEDFSRSVMLYLTLLYPLFSYFTRELWKAFLKKKENLVAGQSLLLVTSSDIAKNVVDNVRKHNYAGYYLVGIVLLDQDMTGRKICGIPVVANAKTAPIYVCQKWVDEVLVIPSETTPYPGELMKQLEETGVTVHMNLTKTVNETGKKKFVEKIGNYTVLTTSMNYATAGELLVKRLMDILGGLVGCLLTGVIFLFVAPMIYISSPGPIFFAQERVGENGKRFKIYKFRSMYMDAEERKKELMSRNEMQGLMFKMEADPRIIGSGSNGTKKGLGWFIRKTSLDEFPQFWNVLKGDMSLVGTRPPTVDEWNQYDYHHRARMAIKPGITGMWQVSGRSDITDFEEVVKLDKEYIENWNIGLDIKILLKTVLVVFKGVGSK